MTVTAESPRRARRRASLTAIGVALVALIGHAAPVATSATAGAAANHQVPLLGVFRGVETTTGAFPIITIQGDWTGVANQLGRFTVENPHVVDLRTSDGTGTFEFTAANGDTLTADDSGHATFPRPNVLSIVEHGNITGGTGRFAGATGSFDVKRVEDGTTGRTIGFFSGTISTP
jgi:hypothetical protein